MGLLADIGRAQPLTSGTRGLSDIQTEITNRRIGLAEEARREKAFQYQERALQEKEAMANRFIPLDELFKTSMPNSTQSQQKDLYDFGKSIGVIDNVAGREGILYKNLIIASDILSKRTDIHKKLAMSGLGDIEQTIPQLEQALQAETKPEKQNIINAQLVKARTRRTELLNTIKALDEDLLKEQVKASYKGVEIGKVSPDKFTPESVAVFSKTGNYKDLIPIEKTEKSIERTVDLGDKVEYIYTDGTRETKPKGVSPNTAIRINMGDTRADARFAMNLRKEFNALQPIKDYRDMTTKFNVMQEAFKESKKTNNYVAVDQALITLYNKMTDPQSVVRESEYVRTPEDMALVNRMKAAVIRVGKGGRLEPDSRQAIMVMAGKFRQAYERKYNEIANEYRGYAQSSGINPEDVVKPVKEEKQQIRDTSKAINYLKSATDRNDAKNRMKALMKAGWDEEELREIEKQAGY